ncbi:MAG: acyl-CoA synthetase [Chitinophagales bacterium]
MIQLIQNATQYLERTAIKSNGKAYSYQQLLEVSKNIALHLLKGKKDLQEARIAFLVPAGFQYVCLQWGIWRAGCIAVPLCVKHPRPSLQYVIEDTQAETVIYSPEFDNLLKPLVLTNQTQTQFIPSAYFNNSAENFDLPNIVPSRRAMILYTSGTTGSPKGVVTTHQNIQTQITSLTTSWKWQADDHILNILPLHHVHGIINILSCALWSGACCEFLPKFDAAKVLSIFCKGEINLFMAVPTIYYQLIAHWNKLPKIEQEQISAALKNFRLMVSGSAALPVSVLEQWRAISEHTLLERYGMTEMGMAISNPYRGKRRPGHIGQPLAGVRIRLVNEQNELVEEGTSGEIQIKGANVFKEYWQKPEATQATFTTDGWFKTGDIAVFEAGYYRILGRNSVDIIKSGGYKISALEIEEVLRTHPQIKECGVVGIPNEEWGEIIGASLITDEQELDLDALKVWLKNRLPSYKIPRLYIFQEDLPRNVMGKVTKNELKKLFEFMS